MNLLKYIDNSLYMEDASVEEISKVVGTPFYCYSTAIIKQNYHAFSQAFENMDVMICYAMKANSNQAIIKTLKNLGSGLDIVSEGELHRALIAGVSAERIVFSGVGKTPHEMDLALKKGIYCLNVESEAELEILNQRAISLGKVAPIAFRVNPDIDANTHKKISTGKKEDKFGIPLHRIRSIYAYAKTLPGIQIKGIDMHIGSQINEMTVFNEAFKFLRHLTEELRSDGHKIEHIDIGGGLGISYHKNDHSLSPIVYAKLVKEHFGDLDCRIITEPGRFLVGNAGVLITQVLYVKDTGDKHFIIIDAAMNDFMRPTLYGAHHEIKPVKISSMNLKPIIADIVGAICESGDFIALDKEIEPPKPEDLLYIETAGAYGAVQSGTYNSRLLIPEVLVKGSQFHIIRPRKTYAELIAIDSIPNWLA
ncbi:Diaminopimelate decarboxylase [Liberibacter crescens BT-1]|uniref:Diaminopimelate decarboxylase n=1 Tax=Liberibacter crescens (strain BT-1) TaxID=1215343 RepID=L0ETC1_LIBCB|nr:diaminopimelate decarboxylase [Liberibacter crescens]AGA64202.1 Diaminopimelate decarboxylase [Liberibacter crescens BT-1]AMC12455.1 diaminopimelate decarboxylase [Liberibacter crescens]